MTEYGYESAPDEPFRYRACPFCEHPEPSLAIYWDVSRFRCIHCGTEGELTRLPGKHYPSPGVTVRVKPEDQGFG